MISDSVKTLLLSIAAAIAAIAAALYLFAGGPGSLNPTPSDSPLSSPSTTFSALPSPSSSPVATSSPSPAVSAMPVPTPIPPTPQPSTTPKGISMSASRGETVSFTLPGSLGTGCIDFAPTLPPGVTASFFEVHSVTTKTPSYQGLAVGAYNDILDPATQLCGLPVWVDLAVSVAALSGDYTLTVAGTPVSLRVWKMVMPLAGPIPFYTELTHSNVGDAFGLTDDPTHQAARFAATAAFSAMLRANRIEPIKQNVNNFPKVKSDGSFDLDTPQIVATGASFRAMVLDSALYPPCLVWADKTTPTPSLLTALQNGISSGTLPKGTWAYVYDESNSAAALARAKLLRGVTGLTTMLTHEYDASFAPYVDTFVPVMDWLNQPGHVAASGYPKSIWTYWSCMGQGSCTNGAPTKWTGFPTNVLDAPGVHRRAAVWIAYQEASGMLYYDSVYTLKTARTDQYKFGGNGDGTLFYPSLTGIYPVASVRLKEYGQAMSDLWYLEWAKRAGVVYTSPVKSATVWSQKDSDYQTVRDNLGEQLNAR